MTDYEVRTLDELREIYPPPSERAVKKQQDRLDAHCRRFISMSPFVLISTASGTGECDVSPKGGPPGFSEVLDDHRLVIPDATGNRRLDGLANIIENPHVGLLFLIPTMRETLRINGRVTLTRDPRFLGLPTGGKPAALALIVEVTEAYLHCAKALIRSELWDPARWPDPAVVPSAAEIFADHMGLDVDASAAELDESYATRI